MPHYPGTLDQFYATGSVLDAAQYKDTFFTSTLDERQIHAESASHDQRTHARFDCQLLHIRPVPTDDDVIVDIALLLRHAQTASDGGFAGRADQENEFFFFLGLRGGCPADIRLQGHDDFVQAGHHVPNRITFSVRGDEQLQQIEKAQDAMNLAIVIQHRRTPDTAGHHSTISCEKGVVQGDIHDISAADAGSSESDVGDQARLLHASGLQHPGGALGDVATANRLRWLASGHPQEGGMGDCRTDSVRIRVPVAYDVERRIFGHMNFINSHLRLLSDRRKLPEYRVQ